jgi:hypothetical protein
MRAINELKKRAKQRIRRLVRKVAGRLEDVADAAAGWTAAPAPVRVPVRARPGRR